MPDVQFHMMRRTGHPDFLDLPWGVALAAWESPRLVEVPRGLSRHVVRFVDYEGALYALKELPRRLAEREYRLLAELARLSIPVVDVAAIVVDRLAAGPAVQGSDQSLDAILITRHLDFSLPYRMVFTEPALAAHRERLMDALANLLVRLHLVGFFWGDCSLSNALFRRDAGALAAYVVDTETAEMHPSLSDGQRNHDLLIAEENLAGELMDLQAAGSLSRTLDPQTEAAALRGRYESLWLELTHEELIGSDQRYRIEERLRRLNELGFDVEEVDLVAQAGGYRLRLHPQVVEPDRHARALQALTGLQVQENQARRLLNDIAVFRQGIERGHAPMARNVLAYRWLSECFEPTIAAIPMELRGKLEPAELYHQVLEHRWYCSEAAGHDVGMREAVVSFVNTVLRKLPDAAAPSADEA